MIILIRRQNEKRGNHNILNIFPIFGNIKPPYALASMTLALSCMCTGSLQRQKCFILCEEQYLPGTLCTMCVIIVQFSFFIGAAPMRIFLEKTDLFRFCTFLRMPTPFFSGRSFSFMWCVVEGEQRLMVEL